MQFTPSRTETIAVRGLRYNVRHWGPEDAPIVFFLHGWMDSSCTFQFVVDSLAQPWHVIAPDWRGYGDSEWLSQPYWFPDYYADLHCLAGHYSKDRPVRLVGHSMGANIASVYAAVKPERVSQVVMIDFLGLKPQPSIDFPGAVGRWLQFVEEPPRLRAYDSHEALARRLMAVNPRLTEERGRFLSTHGSRVRRDDGKIEMACDPWHKVPSPTVYRIEDSMASWRKIEAPVLMVVSDHGNIQSRFGKEPGEIQRRLDAFPSVQLHTIADAGHNIQHDQPEKLAAAIEKFLARD